MCKKIHPYQPNVESLSVLNNSDSLFERSNLHTINTWSWIEDAGDSIPAESEQARKAYLDRLLENIAISVIRCGDDSRVKYKAIFIGYRTQWIPEGYVDCALTCAPYVVLAKDALPKGGAEQLLDITISEWEKDLNLPALR